MKFKVSVMVAGDPAVCQQDTGTRKELSKIYSSNVSSTMRFMQRHPEVTGITLTYGSVNYVINKLSKYEISNGKEGSLSH